MDKFWGTALRKQSVWRGNGGMEPNLTTCSIMQGQRDASPSSEQRHGTTASTHSLHLLAPQCTSILSHLGSLAPCNIYLTLRQCFGTLLLCNHPEAPVIATGQLHGWEQWERLAHPWLLHFPVSQGPLLLKPPPW